jgi:dimethylhistidine N-methyltransferase
MPPRDRDRFELISPERADSAASFAEEVEAGLTAAQKHLPCRFLYDEAGSRLFEEICDLPEYYLTRCEHSILEERAREIAARFAAPVTLVELGTGSATKTRLLIEAFLARHGRLRFAPIDISRGMLERASALLLADYPELEIKAFAGRYESGLAELAHERGTTRLTLWLGSSVGNLDRSEAAAFLSSVRSQMGERDRLLIGIDLRKDARALERAYDDSQGVTAEFNLNLLTRINGELGGEFETRYFRHRAIWKPDPGRVESHLVSLRAQRVRVDALGRSFDFAAGESIHTENSYKYSQAEIQQLARGSGMRCEQQWLDADGRYSLNLFAPSGSPLGE